VDIRKLENWEAAIVASLVERRQRIIREMVEPINAAINQLAEQWGGESGQYEFQGRADGVWLVRMEKGEGA